MAGWFKFLFCLDLRVHQFHPRMQWKMRRKGANMVDKDALLASPGGCLYSVASLLKHISPNVKPHTQTCSKRNYALFSDSQLFETLHTSASLSTIRNDQDLTLCNSTKFSCLFPILPPLPAVFSQDNVKQRDSEVRRVWFYL